MATTPAQHAPRPRDPLPANIIPADASRQKAALAHNRRHGRLNSLRRAKNSTEQLRQRVRGASTGSSSPLRPDDHRVGSRFAVGNVGSNGVIYLRPVAAPRAATPRSRPPQQAPFVFPPATPPDSAVTDGQGLRPSNGLHESFPSGSHTPTPAPTPPLAFNALRKKHSLPLASKRGTHVRSHSFSTVDDYSVSPGSDSHTFKVVIDRPTQARPRTANSVDHPVLEVPIPSYKLGTPRFSDRGTVLLRSSVCTRTSGTDDVRSSFFSRITPEYNKLFPPPPPLPAQSHASRRFSDNSQPHLSRPYAMDRPSTQPSSSQVSANSLGPQIYDALTINPDDQAVVRYAPTGEIVAATPSRLIAHITSPSFLDYELLSDFFLTFRSYLSISQLVDYLIARLTWAVQRADDFGRIVRVRTFVALRHWILNYFVDDFVPRYSIRTHFSKLVNSLYHDLQNREDGGGGDLKIIGELKKCWRRTCALYWDDVETIGRDEPDDDILPGGRFEEEAPEPPIPQPPSRPLTGTQENLTSRRGKASGLSLHAGLIMAGTERHTEGPEHSHHAQQQSMASNPYSSNTNDAPLSPASEASMQVASCSFPLRSLYRGEPTSSTSLHPHPVPARVSMIGGMSGSLRKESKTGRNHQRSGSFSDALRDHRVRPSLSRKQTTYSEEITIFIPGSLVRGAMYQPDSPYINLKRQSLKPLKPASDTVGDMTPPGTAKSNLTVNPGMKKIFGSVRRALSNRQAMSSSSRDGQAVERENTFSEPFGTTTFVQGGVPTPRRVQLMQQREREREQREQREREREKPQLRVDALAARVNESFQRALSQELEREKQHRESVISQQRQSEPLGQRPSPKLDRQQSAMTNFTLGSRSILIMDDTGAPPVPTMSMSGAIPQTTSMTEPSKLYERDSRLGVPGGISDSSRSNIEPLVSLDQMQSSASASASETMQQWATTPPLSRAMSGRPSLRPSLLRHSKSQRGSARHSGSLSLRRFASFHSGLTRHKQGISEYLNTVSDVLDGSSVNSEQFQLEKPPPRMLRRRPGGDLRAAGNVHDLEPAPRSISTGSVSNFAHSVANSMASPYQISSVMPPSPTTEHHARHEVPGLLSPDMLAPEKLQPKQGSVSLVATHSSQPNLRPSFEAEVARLAALPDDEDDGGIESALAKLEGKYEKKTPETSPQQETFYIPESTRSAEEDAAEPPSIRRAHREEEYGEPRDLKETPRQTLVHGDSSINMSPFSGQSTAPRQMTDRSAIGSESSYSSIPILERGGFNEIAAATRKKLELTRESARVAPLSPSRFRPPMESKSSQNSSVEFVEETESMRRIPIGGTMPKTPNSSRSPKSPRSPTTPKSFNTHQSFMLTEHEDLDDISSAMSTNRANSEHYSHRVKSFFDDEPADLEFDERILPHPLRLASSPRVYSLDKPQQGSGQGITEFHQGLPTPGLTPTMTAQGLDRVATRNDSKGIELTNMKHGLGQPEEQPRHIPFILLYDSETLAQQFTLIEKDALDEIDWKELIELRWKQSSPNIRDWVEYLRSTESHGVDVVIARFNVMVKWALSECVLTENMDERVRCIVKYIHIASHCRRLRNYATMYQITIALLSTDCARLTKTWNNVPSFEKQTLRELESLVQPVKNFHNLRMEMETSHLEDGCVPFVGLYTRDLVYNAQKPAYIGDAPSPNGGEPLVNFERHHTAATIVKNLLRLLEAASRYQFKPVPEIISRCLWMAALDDAEISVLSRRLE